jgi:hypothetical protein
VSIAITAGSNPSASGASVTFTATPTNGGTTPSYQWKVGTTNVGTNSATYTTTTLTNGQVVTCVMTSNATCAVPASGTSNAITMSITGGTVTYCTGSTTSTAYERITNVTMGSINNTTGASSYSNYTALSTNVVPGTGTPITVTVGNLYTTDKVYIWCDWNRNGTLTDAGEAVYASVAGGPFGTTITAPVGTSTGAVRMRIRLTDSAAGPNATPCGTSTYGELEDYTLNVVAAMPLQGGGAVNTADTRAIDATPLTQADKLLVYPNPSRGSCTIKATNAGTYYLMNDMGQLVRSFTLNGENDNTILINDLGPGTYVVSGQNKFGVVKQKIVVTQ